MRRIFTWKTLTQHTTRLIKYHHQIFNGKIKLREIIPENEFDPDWSRFEWIIQCRLSGRWKSGVEENSLSDGLECLSAEKMDTRRERPTCRKIGSNRSDRNRPITGSFVFAVVSMPIAGFEVEFVAGAFRLWNFTVSTRKSPGKCVIFPPAPPHWSTFSLINSPPIAICAD